MKRTTKPVSAATRALLDEMRADARPDGDKLERARDMVRELRDREVEAAQLEERLAAAKAEIRQIKEKSLPDFFDEVGVPSLRIAAEGNLPEFEVAIADRFHANIPDETEGDAFSYLGKTGHGDLIKTTFTITFGLGEAKATERFARSLDKAGIQYSAKRGVPWNTLTAWFREEHRRKPLTPKVMAILGATVGRVAKVVKQKEKK